MSTEQSSPPRINPLATGALLGANVLVFLGLFALAPDLPAVRDRFGGASGLLIELVGAMSGFSFALGSLVVGRVIGRFGYRSVYVASLLLFAAAGSAAAALPNLAAIMLTRAVVGLACAGIVNSALVAIGRLLPEKEQNRILGLQTLIGSVVAILGFPLVGQLAAVDWRLAFLLHLIALAFVPLALRLPQSDPEAEPAATLPPGRSVGVLVLATAVFAGMVVFIATVFGPLFLASLGERNAALLSMPPTAASIGSVIGSSLYVVIRPRVRIAGAFALALAAMALGLAITAVSTGVWGVAAGSLVVVIGAGAFSPNLNSAAISASPDNPAPTLGMVNALQYGSMILFPFVATAFSTGVGGPQRIILIYAAVAGALAAAFAFAGRKHAPDRDTRAAPI